MKLIHVSDLRLNSACEAFGADAAARKQEMWNTFREICHACNSRQVGLLLLSGNIFDREPTFDEMDKVREILATLNNTAVVWIAGFRDCIREDYSYAYYPWPENVHIIKAAGKIHLPALGCNVTGVSYNSVAMDPDILSYLKTENTEEVQLLMLCGDEEHMGIRHEKIAAKGFDYVALGGKQNFQIWENERCAYSGSPEPFDSAGIGNHGYMYVNVTKNGTSIEHVDIASRHFKSSIIFVNEKMTIADIRKSWKNDHFHKRENIYYKLMVKGKMPAGVSIEDMEKLEGVFEVIDLTVGGYDRKALASKHNNDILGAFLESMETEEGDIAKVAEALGIASLLKGDNA